MSDKSVLMKMSEQALLYAKQNDIENMTNELMRILK